MMKENNLIILVVVGVVIGICAQSLALTFTTPNYKGDVTFRVGGVSNGTAYAAPAGGVGLSSANVDAADAAIAATGAGALTGVGYSPWSLATTPNASCDTWGISYIDSIRGGSNASDPAIWEPAAGNPEGTYMVAVFYGQEDYNVAFTTASNALIHGHGLRVDLWEIPAGFDWTTTRDQGSAGRIGLSGYTGVTDVGTLVLSSVSVPGFISSADPDATFESQFDFLIAGGNNTGSGVAFLSMASTTGGTGTDNWKFDTDSLVSTYGSYAGTTADLYMTFDTNPHTGENDWFINVNDDIGGYVIPEPATLSVLALGLLAVFRRRR